MTFLGKSNEKLLFTENSQTGIQKLKSRQIKKFHTWTQKSNRNPILPKMVALTQKYISGDIRVLTFHITHHYLLLYCGRNTETNLIHQYLKTWVQKMETVLQGRSNSEYVGNFFSVKVVNLTFNVFTLVWVSSFILPSSHEIIITLPWKQYIELLLRSVHNMFLVICRLRGLGNQTLPTVNLCDEHQLNAQMIK